MHTRASRHTRCAHKSRPSFLCDSRGKLYFSVGQNFKIIENHQMVCIKFAIMIVRSEFWKKPGPICSSCWSFVSVPLWGRDDSLEGKLVLQKLNQQQRFFVVIKGTSHQFGTTWRPIRDQWIHLVIILGLPRGNLGMIRRQFGDNFPKFLLREIMK